MGFTSIFLAAWNLPKAPSPSLQGREAADAGVDLGLRRQHPADLLGLRGHRAGRPQDVAHRAEAAIEGRQEDVGAALGPRAAPGGGSVEGPQRPQRRPKISLQELS